MVHALTEAHRVLKPAGHVVDLHPEGGTVRPRRLPVSIVRNGRATLVGEWPEDDDSYDRYLASDGAVERVIRRGLFKRHGSETFLLRYHFRSLPAFDTMREKWASPPLPPAVRSRLEGLLHVHRDASIVVVEPFRMNVLEKL